MEKQSILYLALTAFLLIPFYVSAAPGTGITPDSHFYFIDTFSEKINLFFIFSSEKKAEKAIEYAEERFGEIREMISRNKTKEAAEATARYKESLDLATKEAGKIKEVEKTEAILGAVSKKAAEHKEELDKIITIEPTPASTFPTVAPTSIIPPSKTRPFVPVPNISFSPVVTTTLSPIIDPTPTHIFPSFYDMPKYQPSSSNSILNKITNILQKMNLFALLSRLID
ncbi:MAG: hypothetical protein HYT63_01335 [Candidatus Yanofskybacteria bacterium]|nr:hypothetical protein [Candidatus Yanofskybacteria bacterium]